LRVIPFSSAAMISVLLFVNATLSAALDLSSKGS
jgi:hypothetical protein